MVTKGPLETQSLPPEVFLEEWGLSHQGSEGQEKVLTSVLSPGWHRVLGLWNVKFQTFRSLALPQCSPPGPPRAREPTLRLWGYRPTVSPVLPRPVLREGPSACAKRGSCCFGENTFWSLLSEPSQLTPTGEKPCQDKWEISS